MRSSQKSQSDLQADKTWQFPGSPQPPSWEWSFGQLVSRYDWLQALDGCLQDALWHAEGDVLTHLGLVMDALVAMHAWRELPAEAREMVFAATLMHDIGKPSCTREEDGRIRSPGHSSKGARMARQILSQPEFGPTPFEIREQIVNLVRFHGLPGNFLEKPQPERAVIRASMTTPLNWLAILATADAQGRRTEQPDDMPQRVEMFADFANEWDCFQRPRKFSSPHNRFEYFRREDAHPTLELYDDCQFEVVMMSGLPAAGKSHWVDKHRGELPVISLDEVREELDIDPAENQGTVFVTARERARVLMRKQQSFIWNATNTTRMLRDQLISLFRDYHARIRIVYCEASWEEICRRNAQRSRPVPQPVIDKLFNRLDVPTLIEAHEVEIFLS